MVDLTKLVLTNSVAALGVVDTTGKDEPRTETNTLYLCQGTNATVEMDIESEWAPDDVTNSMFRWEILTTNGNVVTQWTPNKSTFATNPVTVAWSNVTPNEREFVVNGWFDVNEDGTFSTNEPHRTLYVGVVGLQVKIPGKVAITGDTDNVFFCLTDDSWKNCIWQISPHYPSNGALFCDSPTSEGSNWYWGGTSVWINVGSTDVTYRIEVHANEMPDCDDTAILSVCREPCWTPAGSNIYVWHPVNDGNFSWDFVDELADNYQGWGYSTNSPVTWFTDPSTNDNDCGDCTLANLKSMKDAGIIAVLAHGNTSVVEVARFLSKTNAEAWMCGETNYLMVAPGPYPETNYWKVCAMDLWFETHWKPHLDQRRAIVFLESCFSADGEFSIASSVGGETVFGVKGPGIGADVDAYFDAIVEHMNGKAWQAADWKRPAKIAFDQVLGASSELCLEGSGRSTLCPTPQAVVPDSQEEAKAEWGCIIFDTYMDSFTSAGDAVVSLVGSVEERSWNSDGSGDYFVDFEFSGTNITMEAVSNQCRSSVSVYPGRPLDGDGVAPMPNGGQSKQWSW